MAIQSLSPTDPEEQRLQAAQPVPRAILTRDGERQLRAELERLREEAGTDFVARLREARDFGGSSENDEYLQIKEEEAVLAARIHRLQRLLELAEIVDQSGEGASVAAIGSVVEVRDADSGALRRHRLTGGFALSGSGDVSANSPVGQALLGRAPGDRVSVELPNGKLVRFEVVAVGAEQAKARPGPA